MQLQNGMRSNPSQKEREGERKKSPIKILQDQTGKPGRGRGRESVGRKEEMNEETKEKKTMNIRIIY
jgi:hypothetical protein